MEAPKKIGGPIEHTRTLALSEFLKKYKEITLRVVDATRKVLAENDGDGILRLDGDGNLVAQFGDRVERVGADFELDGPSIELYIGATTREAVDTGNPVNKPQPVQEAPRGSPGSNYDNRIDGPLAFAILAFLRRHNKNSKVVLRVVDVGIKGGRGTTQTSGDPDLGVLRIGDNNTLQAIFGETIVSVVPERPERARYKLEGSSVSLIQEMTRKDDAERETKRREDAARRTAGFNCKPPAGPTAEQPTKIDEKILELERFLYSVFGEDVGSGYGGDIFVFTYAQDLKKFLDLAVDVYDTYEVSIYDRGRGSTLHGIAGRGIASVLHRQLVGAGKTNVMDSLKRTDNLGVGVYGIFFNLKSRLIYVVNKIYYWEHKA